MSRENRPRAASRPVTGAGALAAFWIFGPWSVIALVLAVADATSAGAVSSLLPWGPGTSPYAAAAGPLSFLPSLFTARALAGLFLGLLLLWGILVELFLAPWRSGSRGRGMARDGFFGLGSLKENREPAVALGLVTVILVASLVLGRGGPLFAPTLLAFAGLVIALWCLYSYLAAWDAGTGGAMWKSGEQPASSDLPVRGPAAAFVDGLLEDDTYGGQMVWRREAPPSEGRLAEVVGADSGYPLRGLYEHQAQAWRLLERGLSVLLATPLASGKSTLAALYAAHHCLTTARSVLYLCPDAPHAVRTAVAIARATEREEWEWAVEARALATVQEADDYLDDENMPLPDIALVTPETLHHAILRNHRRWEPLLRNVGFVVLEDIHAYGPAERQHVAYLLRRLWRVLASRDTAPQALVTVAPIAGAREFALDLTGLGIPAEATVTADFRGRPAVQILFWEPPPPPPGDLGTGLSAADAPAGFTPESEAGRTPAVAEACRVMAAAMLYGLDVALVAEARYLSPSFTRTVERNAYRMAKERALAIYRRKRARFAEAVKLQADDLTGYLDDAKDKALQAAEAETDENLRQPLADLVTEVTASFMTMVDDVLTLVRERILKEQLDAERDALTIDKLRQSLEGVLVVPSGWHTTFGGRLDHPVLRALAQMKEKVGTFLVSEALEGIRTTLQDYAANLARLSSARVEICPTLERSTTGDSGQTAALAFDAVVLLGPEDPYTLWRHQLAHLGQGRLGAPNDGVVFFVPLGHPVYHRLALHPEDLFTDEPFGVLPMTLANRGVVKAHLWCAIAEGPMTEAEISRVFGQAGIRAADELVSERVVRAVVTPSDGTIAAEEPPATPADLALPSDLVYSVVDTEESPHDKVVFSVTDGLGVTLVDPAHNSRVLAHVTDMDKVLRAHPGAVLAAGNERYRVRGDQPGLRLRLEDDPWVTEPNVEVKADPPVSGPWITRLAPDCPIEVTRYQGTVRACATGFSEYDGPELGRVRLRVDFAEDRPQAEITTDLLQVALPSLKIDAATAHALAHSLRASLPLLLMQGSGVEVTAIPPAAWLSEPRDRHGEDGNVVCLAWDTCPGGSGVIPAASEVVLRLLEAAFYNLLECHCLDGCPMCLRLLECRRAEPNAHLDKRQALDALGRALAREAEAAEVITARYGRLADLPSPKLYVRRLAREVSALLADRLGIPVGAESTVTFEDAGAAGPASEDTRAAGPASEDPVGPGQRVIAVPGNLREAEALVFLARALVAAWADLPGKLDPDLADLYGLAQRLSAWAGEKVRLFLRLDGPREAEDASWVRQASLIGRLEYIYGVRGLLRNLAAPSEGFKADLARLYEK